MDHQLVDEDDDVCDVDVYDDGDDDDDDDDKYLLHRKSS